jgi:hypothetical protein
MRWVTVVLLVLAALVIGFVLGAGAGGEILTARGWTTGNKYLSLPENIKLVYIAGVSDAYCALSAYEKSQSPRRYSECINGMELAQVDAIAKKYLKDHPEQRHFMMAGIILQAVLASCPE